MSWTENAGESRLKRLFTIAIMMRQEQGQAHTYDNASPADKAKLQPIIDAFKNVDEGLLDIEYYGIKQKANDAGIKDSIDVFKFDVQNPE